MSAQNREWSQERASLERCCDDFRDIVAKLRTDGASRAALARAELETIAEAEVACCVGVVGEFRTGKSSLINALAGGDVAFVDVVEATAIPSCYRYGPQREAVMHKVDGLEEIATVEHANAQLAQHRHDREWLAQLDYVEFRAPLESLRGLELWDAPGFGGSDYNEETAHRFIARITGALWVFDAGLLGNASVVGPLQRLHASRKRVLVALNQVDRLADHAAIDEAVEFVRETLGTLVDDVIPVSAKHAREGAGRDKGENEQLGLLRERIRTHLVEHSVADRHARIGAAVARAADAVRTLVRDERIAAQNALGFLDHAERNLRSAVARILAQAKARLVDEVREAVWGLATTQIEGLRRRAQGSIAKVRGGSLTHGDVEKACAHLATDEAVRFVIEVVTRNTQSYIENEWRRAAAIASDHAVVAQPGVQLARYAPHDGAAEPTLVSHDSEAGHDVGAVLARVGVRLGDAAGMAAITGVSGAAAGVAAIALTSLTITALPALLAGAAVVGLAAGVARLVGFGVHTGASALIGLAEAEGLVGRYAEQLGQRIADDLMGQARFQELATALDGGVEEYVRIAAAKLLGGRERDAMRAWTDSLVPIEGSLRELARQVRRDAAVASGREHDVVTYPVRLQSGARAAGQLVEALGELTDELDLVVAGFDQGIKQVFDLLGPRTVVRLAVIGDGKAPEIARAALTECLAGRPLDLTARQVSHRQGRALLDSCSIVITPDDAFVIDRPLGDVGRVPVTVSRFGDGRQAAQSVFASFWSGVSPQGEELDLVVLR